MQTNSSVVSTRAFPLYPWMILLSFAALLASGCTSVTLAIANVPAVFGKYSVRHDIAYGEGPSRRLDVYQPEGLATNRPVVVFLHGGGWVDGTKNQYRFVADALTNRGYVFIAVNYRLYPEAGFPGFVQDGAQAVQWAHTHAGEFGGDASRLYLMGHSAGAQIAALLAFDERYLRAVGGERAWVKGFIGLAGPYDFLPLRDPELEKIFGPASQYPASQPINFVDGAEPPALLLHGLSDNTVWPRNSQHLAAKIRERGGSVEERYYEGVSHGGILAGLSVYFRNRRPVLEDIAKFVDESPSKTGSGPSASLRPSSP